MKVLDYILLALIAAAFVGALVFLWKSKKAGKCIGCGGQGCPHCEKKNDNLQK